MGVYLARRSIGSSRVSAGGCIGHLSLSLKAHRGWLLSGQNRGRKKKTRGGKCWGSAEQLRHIQQCQLSFKESSNQSEKTLFSVLEWRSDGPAGSRGIVRTGGVELGEGRVKFPLYTWKLGTAATQPLTYLLLPQPRTLYIVLMLLFSCLADGHTAAARITLPQIHQILWPGIKSGVQRETESVLRKCLGCGYTWSFH